MPRVSTIRSLLKFVVFVTALDLLAAAQQSVTFRIVDYRTAKPIARLRVDTESFNGDLSRGMVSKAAIVMRESATTDKHGSFVASIPAPPPEHMRVFSSDLWDSTVDFSPAEALSSGVVVQYSHVTEAEKKKVLPKPGEVVILAKRIRWWNRMLQEIP